MLSGHTHGGQLALPAWFGRRARNLAEFISRFDRGLFRDGDATLYVNRGLGFTGQIAAWLWFTVLFANFAEAMAEGRGKAQADTLRKAKAETVAHRERPDGSLEPVPAPLLRKNEIVRVSAGDRH